MQKIHTEDLTGWARQFGVELPAADLEQMRSLAEQYMVHVNSLRALDLTGEPQFPPHLGRDQELGK